MLVLFSTTPPQTWHMTSENVDIVNTLKKKPVWIIYMLFDALKDIIFTCRWRHYRVDFSFRNVVAGPPPTYTFTICLLWVCILMRQPTTQTSTKLNPPNLFSVSKSRPIVVSAIDSEYNPSCCYKRPTLNQIIDIGDGGSYEVTKAFTSSSGKEYEPHLITSKNNDKLTLITGGVTLNNCEFSVKSFSLSVADMMINLSGFPFCEEKIRFTEN